MSTVAVIAAARTLCDSLDVKPETAVEPGPGRQLTDDEAAYVAGTLGPAIVEEPPTK